MSSTPPLLFDGHLDLAWNALSFDRELTDPVAAINARERGMMDHPSRGNATVALPEMRRGRIAICLATILVHARPDLCPSDGHNRTSLEFRSPTIAGAIGRGQVAYYELLEQAGELRMLQTVSDLNAHWKSLQSSPSDGELSRPVGYILSMEGADPIISPSDVSEWFALGLRIVGPVHYGHNQYAHGTNESGRLKPLGVELLRELERLCMILDTTHLSDEGFFHALDVFSGPVIASHQNCRALVPGCRQFTDEQLRRLIEREAVIGVPFDNWMIVPGWKTGQTPRSESTLERIADHVDHICQLAGTHRHVAIGTDLDGGFGSEQCPAEIETIADVSNFADALLRRGYSNEAIDTIFHGNWLRFFSKHLPA
jgi:membrane dipeptidase